MDVRYVGFVLALAACTADIEAEQVDAVLALQGTVEQGADVYDQECVQCHDEDGLGVKIAPLAYAVPEMSDEAVVYTILSGPLVMPNFERKLSDQAVADVLAFLRDQWGTTPN